MHRRRVLAGGVDGPVVPAGEDVLPCSFGLLDLAQIDMLRVGEPLKMIKTNINPKSMMLSRYASTFLPLFVVLVLEAAVGVV